MEVSEKLQVHAPEAGSTQTDDERRWLERVQRTLEQDSAEKLGVAAKVLDVPRALRNTKPEAYQPHGFALGPYHQTRPELRNMERFKLAAAKRVEKHFAGGRKIRDLVQLYLDGGLDNEIRATYHRCMDMDEVTLAWMMAIDTCFLLDFLIKYETSHTKSPSSAASHHNMVNAVVRDAMMLENQVPLFLLPKTRVLCTASGDERRTARYLRTVLDRFVKDVSPIKMVTSRPVVGDDDDIANNRPAHLLELLYRFLVPGSVTVAAAAFDDDEVSGGGHLEHQDDDPPAEEPSQVVDDDVEKQQQFQDTDKVKQACAQVSSLNVIKRKMPPVVAGLLPLLCKFFAPPSSNNNEPQQQDGGGMDHGSIANSPLAQEIKVPSVAQLAECGVRFARAPNGIAGIHFNPRTATLHLPAITLDCNTEVILRNLVAYEAVAVRGPLVLARYTELMNGIIDSARDVKILKQSKVVTNKMKSNKEAAEMWNGMCRATRISKVPHLDDVIRAVNEHRNRTTRVWAQKLLRKYVFRSWKMLTLLASVVLLLMTALQTFCSAYPCERTWFGALVAQLPAEASD